ncbi:fasciclin domain-containing protein [Armatimonas sp.]|uniref:fasciclin domain-containing protein n=1 Tax=Armatimonas sp. TaxID=1872638 RepID=UPI00286A36D0|nr:fasciclin domain-containing protein [Armatimonas sp.]
MNFKNRIFRMASALTIVGIIAAQIPTRSSVSLAADDGCPKSNNNGGAIALGAAGVFLLAKNAPRIGSGSMKTNIALGGNSPIAMITRDHSEFKLIGRILNNSGLFEKYSQGSYTVFWPTDEALLKALGQAEVDRLTSAAGVADAVTLLNRLTVAEDRLSISKLKDRANANGFVTTISNESLSLKLEGDKLTVNGVPVISEFPANNGFIVSTNGLLPGSEASQE